MKIEVCTSPALYPFYKKEGDIVIVVDVFRATTTICAAFANGVGSIKPVGNIEEAKHYKSEGYLVGAERNTQKCDFADFGNSPFEYKASIVKGKDIVFTTTNGTRAIETAQGCKELYIGAFSNMNALVEKCVEKNERIVVICSGWNNRINLEDTLFAGAFVEKMKLITAVEADSDAPVMVLGLWESAKANPLDFVKNSEHYRRLQLHGFENDAEYCLAQNTVALVPYYDLKTKLLRV
ncbi:MAG: 2-phosphosulfolactate phosphatase [Dysgonamonadaceae bacterium]